jgi:hypothetical protein
MTNTALFNIWAKMKQRCMNPNSKDYPRYGGRGITLCERWLKFERFFTDMGTGYKSSLTLDRIDNNGPYSPENCRWATSSEQSNNRRSNKRIQTPLGEMTVAQAALAYGVKKSTLEARLGRYGWSVEKALNLSTT